MNNPSSSRFNGPRYSMTTALVLSIILDLIGVLTYIFPIIGETFDIAWAPISAFMLQHLYGNWVISMLGGLEEVSPGLDFIPTAFLAWVYTYVLNTSHRWPPN